MTRREFLILSGLTALLLALPRFLFADDKTPDKKPSDAEADVKKITLAEFEKMRADDTDKSVVVLDVRTAKEWDGGRIPGAVHIDWHSRDFNDQVAKLDKSKKYLVYCQSGVRSTAAASRMATLGFANLFNFTGGWSEYSKSGKPVGK